MWTINIWQMIFKSTPWLLRFTGFSGPEGISGNLVILTMKKKSASTYIDDDIGIVQCFNARNKREDPTGRTLLPQTSLKKNKKPPLYNCQVLI